MKNILPPSYPNEYILHKNYAELAVTSEKYGRFTTLIDLDDVDKCKPYHWGIRKSYNQNYDTYYIGANRKKGTNKPLLLHRYLMNVTETNDWVDHIDGNKLNNRKQNLRRCDLSQNNINNKMYYTNKSGHKGVHFDTSLVTPKWMAWVCINKKRKHLGYFNTYDDAVIAREEAERKYYGEFNREIV